MFKEVAYIQFNKALKWKSITHDLRFQSDSLTNQEGL